MASRQYAHVRMPVRANSRNVGMTAVTIPKIDQRTMMAAFSYDQDG
jgi:hypothetical protein